MLNTHLTLRIQIGTPPQPSGHEGCVWRNPDGSVCGRSHINTDDLRLEWHDTGVFVFRRESDVVRAWPIDGVSPTAIRAQFDREITALILQSHGAEAMHASAVGCGTGAILICGSTGAGKSTLAYALGVAGCDHLADDHVVFDIDDGRPFLRPLPFSSSLRPLSRRHFGTAGAETRTPVDTRVPIAGIVLLRQDAALPDACRHERVAASEAFTALLPHAHCFDLNDPGEVARFVNDYGTLVDRVPVYAMRYRPDFSTLSLVVAQTAALFDNDEVKSATGASSSAGD